MENNWRAFHAFVLGLLAILIALFSLATWIYQ
jgi:hypothetical protein